MASEQVNRIDGLPKSEVSEITGLPVYETPKPTEEELRKEYRFLLAEELTKKLLEKGMISDDEFDRIMEKNRETFLPQISKIA